MITYTRAVLKAGCRAALITTIAAVGTAHANDESWKKDQIADALSAGPPSVTRDARVYAWDANGQMILLRHGTGPYSCVASGNTSTRVGRSPLPYPDPMCLDENAWRFFQVLWSERNPMTPSRPYPIAPGMVWMLAGMGVGDGMVKIGSSADAEAAVAGSGKTITRLSPHLMIMPFPVDEKTSGMPTTYDPSDPQASWVMFAGTPIEHVMVHFSEEAAMSMMQGAR